MDDYDPRVHEILYNDAALNSLKRHQLQSLSKRYGLKSNGKNTEIIQRLQDHASTLPSHLRLNIPDPAPTPMKGHTFSDTAEEDDTSSMACSSPNLPQPPIRDLLQGRLPKSSAVSDSWEVLSDSGASLISPVKELRTDDSTIKSWKSAGNGETLDEFGGLEGRDLTLTRNSIKSIASSPKRSASRSLLSTRSRRNSVNLLDQTERPATVAPVETPAIEQEAMEMMIDNLPPSPASTIGVPKRYSGVSLLERPSTIRLVASPCPSEEDQPAVDDLPFFEKAKHIYTLKERRSMAPIRSPGGPASPLHLGRKSMPAMMASTSASVPSIYPPLPTMPAHFARPESPVKMPGALPTSPPKPIFTFGQDMGISNQAFSDVGRSILQQMNAKLGGDAFLGEELLRGINAEVAKLVSTDKNLGESGWGLSGSSTDAAKKDRFARIHEREFAKLQSISKQDLKSSLASNRTIAAISTTTLNAGSTPAKRKRSSSTHLLPSAPNGGPEAGNDPEPSAKKPRMPYLGSIRSASKSLLNLGNSVNTSSLLEQKHEENKGVRQKQKRRSSLIFGTERGLRSKFGWFSRKKKVLPPASHAGSATPLKSSVLRPSPTMPRKTSVYASRDPPQPRKQFDLNASLSRTQTSHTLTRPPSFAASTLAASQKRRQASSSAQTVMSLSSSRSRSKLPDFGPVPTMPSSAASSTVNTLGLPKSNSSSLASSTRKQSQAEIIRTARPAPPPPVPSQAPIGHATSATITTAASRLYAPTASSLARMQATVKPNAARPLPAVPAAVQAFGAASSRENIVFQANFEVDKPAIKVNAPASPLRNPKSRAVSNIKSPLKHAASSRLRANTSGVNALKSRGDLKRDMEVQVRKAGIKAKQERLAEERDLKRMLGGDHGL